MNAIPANETARPDGAVPEGHGVEITRYLSPGRGALISVRDLGETWALEPGGEWRRIRVKKPDVPLEKWRADKLAAIEAKIPWWARDVQKLPSLHELEDWQFDGGCESVTGDWVEPDGHGPDGAPSWLVALGMI
jgi:hypothetical protein